jgi:hypothetical protein
LAFYEFFFESFHWTLEDVHACPIYLACILLGAIGPDQTNVRMTWKDTMRYYAGDPAKMKALSMLTKKGPGHRLAGKQQTKVKRAPTKPRRGRK